jgi:putative membrane protein
MTGVASALGLISFDERLWNGLAVTAVFGLLGIFLLILGFKLFDWLMPHIKVEEELCKHNMAVAVVMAAAILGISAVLVAAITG